jgi:hypothetical protein
VEAVMVSMLDGVDVRQKPCRTSIDGDFGNFGTEIRIKVDQNFRRTDQTF